MGGLGGALVHVPLGVVAYSTVGLLTVVVPKFQLSAKLVAALFAAVIPALVPSSFKAAASAAESQKCCVSFLMMKTWPMSTANPSAPISAIAAAAIVINTKPRSLFFRRIIMGHLLLPLCNRLPTRMPADANRENLPVRSTILRLTLACLQGLQVK